MNEEQIFVKMNLDPMLNICDFLNEFFKSQIKYTQESTTYKLAPEKQHAKLAALQVAQSKFNHIYQHLLGLHSQLQQTDALKHATLASVYPNFMAEVTASRGELMQLFTVHSI